MAAWNGGSLNASGRLAIADATGKSERLAMAAERDAVEVSGTECRLPFVRPSSPDGRVFSAMPYFHNRRGKKRNSNFFRKSA